MHGVLVANWKNLCKPHNIKHLAPMGKREAEWYSLHFLELLINHSYFLKKKKKNCCAAFPHRCGSTAFKAPAEHLIIPDIADYDTKKMVSAPVLSTQSNTRCHLHLINWCLQRKKKFKLTASFLSKTEHWYNYLAWCWN